MINENFVIIGAILIFIGSINYLLDTIKGKTMPNRISWFLWALAPLVAFTAEIRQGVGIQSLMTFMVGFSPLLIFLASFVNKKSVWQLSRFDVICGLLSVTGLIFWYITKSGNIAIIFSIFADGLAAIPTIVKSYKAPETESGLIYLMSAISGVITLLTIQTWNFATFGFPAYLVLVCSTIFILIQFKPIKFLR